MTRPEFQVYLPNAAGIVDAKKLGDIFSEALDKIEQLVPPGRDRALVVTKMQEASFFAKRGVATKPENQSVYIRGTEPQKDA